MEHNNNNISYYKLEIKLKCKYHKHIINCSTILNDGRIVTCSDDESIIIYNNKTFKPELIIKEHTEPVNYILKLFSGMLASCSNDSTIKIFNIKYKNYELLQTLNYHKDWVYKIIELNNKKLVSCSYNSPIFVYSKDNNNKYTKDYDIITNAKCFCIIQTKENEICYNDENANCSIFFYDLLTLKVIKNIRNISVSSQDSFNMITKDLLLITGKDNLYIINVNNHKLKRTIYVPDSSVITTSCMLNKNIIVTGDSNKKIKQWKIEGNNLILISKKENAHISRITTIKKLKDGYILSGSFDGDFKIWHYYLSN